MAWFHCNSHSHTHIYWCVLRMGSEPPPDWSLMAVMMQRLETDMPPASVILRLSKRQHPVLPFACTSERQADGLPLRPTETPSALGWMY